MSSVLVGVIVWAVVCFIMIKIKKESPIMWITTLPLFVIVFLGMGYVYDLYTLDVQYDKYLMDVVESFE